jgi:hypothetical protein
VFKSNLINPKTAFMFKTFFMLFSAVLIQSALPGSSYAQDAKDSTPAKTIVEFAEPMARQGSGLSTVSYKPSEKELSFFQRLPGEEKTTGGMFNDYDIKGKKGKPVGWFGIVRGITMDAVAGQASYLIEMKYFDGLSDGHIMLVGFSGAGDFKAIVKGNTQEIKLLSLIKVYGIVSDELNSIPVVSADYIRVWDWGLFTFMSYGEQKGNKKWKKLNKVDEKHIYDPSPDNQFYEDRLGKRE